MEITFWGFVLGLLLLAIPIYIIYAFDLLLLKRLLRAGCWLVLATGVLGLIIHLLITCHSVWLNILTAILLSLAAAAVVVGRSRLPLKRLYLPLAAGMAVPMLVLGAYVLFLVLSINKPLEAQTLIPVVSLMTGCSMGLVAKALRTYYMGLEHHNQLYYYLLGNGSTHHEAVRYCLRRAFQAALVPVMKRMSGMLVLTAPVLMLVMVWCGIGVFTAVACEALLFIVVMAYTLSALFLSLWLARRYAFDEYEHLKK